ncbi:MAG: hypothetical protein HC849_34205 [Oscillatoriales cyanobacterium RU_3_3]|nr:hypothetical protein [Microcoleus sp. SU_5_6]NJM64052.1 hypothetical protein [Oscillatoriales cyanobacterium RU_3_3]
MTQETDGKNRITSIGMAALALAVLLFLSGLAEGGLTTLRGNLAENWSGEKITVFYWAVLFYHSAKLPVAGIILLLVLILANRLCDRVQQQASFSATLSALLLSLIAGASVLWIVFLVALPPTNTLPVKGLAGTDTI